MKNLDSLLNSRMEKGAQSLKVKQLAQKSSEGNLTSFSGLFKVGELTEVEKFSLESILKTYLEEQKEITEDLQSLIEITSEVKAIHNQAALLHGERIKKVQTLLKKYKEGAFSAWLVAAYGNRQTPYNFLLYYEFYQELQPPVRLKIEGMPRQAVYALASRKAPLQKKQEVIDLYSGQTKKEMLDIIRDHFPLDKEDGRRTDEGQAILTAITKILYSYKKRKENISEETKQEIKKTLNHFMLAL